VQDSLTSPPTRDAESRWPSVKKRNITQSIAVKTGRNLSLSVSYLDIALRFGHLWSRLFLEAYERLKPISNQQPPIADLEHPYTFSIINSTTGTN